MKEKEGKMGEHKREMNKRSMRVLKGMKEKEGNDGEHKHEMNERSKRVLLFVTPEITTDND